MDEFRIIEDLLKPLTSGMPAALSLSDDAAVITPPPGHDLVMTKDAMVADVHFLPDDPPDLIARKLLRVNLSDLAAMGATPYGYLLATAWSRDITNAWIGKFVEGLAQDQKQYDVGLLGGDTVATSGPLTLSLTAVGTVPTGQAVKRGGAEPGDRLMVTGTLGDAWIGLQVLKGRLAPEDQDHFALSYRLPDPPVAFGARIAGIANAAIDISDGLIADLGHLTEVSGVGAAMTRAAIPVSEGAAALIGEGAVKVDELMVGGDDYQLLMAVPADRTAALQALASDMAVELTDIGEVTKASGITLDGKALDQAQLGAGGYRHQL